MLNIQEKKFSSKELGIELTSYIDKQQNIWFRGRDVAKILGYSKPENAIERHVSKNHKILQLCCSPETGYQKNDTRGKCCSPETGYQKNDTTGKCCSPETGYQKNDTRGKYCLFIDESGFYELVFSSKLEFAKKSVIGYLLQFFHL